MEISQERYKQEWLNAGITNDFIFGNVMQMGDNCLHLLQAILPELHLQRIKFVNTQKDIRTDHLRKGVRLDVFAEDIDHRVYDIEMQVQKKSSVGKRVRYYQSKIDADALRSGDDVDNIKSSYIIFLMPDDAFGLQRRRYTFHYHCDEEPVLQLATASNVIFLNSRGIKGNVSTNLQDFFALMNKEQPSARKFIRTISQDIQRVKTDPAKEREFMDYAMKMHDVREEAQQETNQQAAKSVAINLKRRGESVEYIQQFLSDSFGRNLSKEDIDDIVNSLS